MTKHTAHAAAMTALRAYADVLHMSHKRTARLVAAAILRDVDRPQTIHWSIDRISEMPFTSQRETALIALEALADAVCDELDAERKPIAETLAPLVGGEAKCGQEDCG